MWWNILSIVLVLCFSHIVDFKENYMFNVCIVHLIYWIIIYSFIYVFLLNLVHHNLIPEKAVSIRLFSSPFHKALEVQPLSLMNSSSFIIRTTAITPIQTRIFIVYVYMSSGTCTIGFYCIRMCWVIWKVLLIRAFGGTINNAGWSFDKQ